MIDMRIVLILDTPCKLLRKITALVDLRCTKFICMMYLVFSIYESVHHLCFSPYPS